MVFFLCAVIDYGRSMRYTCACMVIEQLDALGFRRGKFRKRRHGVFGVVIHTTGSGPWRRWTNSGDFEDPYDAAKHVYTEVVEESGHLLVCGDTGRIAQLAPFDTVAWHVGSRGGYRYRWPAWHRLSRNVGWWKKRWPEFKSPRDLLGGWAWEFSPNALTIGIEVSPPMQGPRHAWSVHTWRTLAEMCDRLQRAYVIPALPEYFVGHSDIHPIARSNRKGPWDPGPAQFSPRRDFEKLFPSNVRRYG